MPNTTLPHTVLEEIKKEVDLLHAFLESPPWDDNLKWEAFFKQRQTALNQAIDKHLERLWLPNSVEQTLTGIVKNIGDGMVSSHGQGALKLAAIGQLVEAILKRAKV